MIALKSKYALRALIALARAGPGETLQIGTIAAREAIPKKFLEQILLDLKHAGLVASRRGQHGGYHLLRAPQEIAFGEVLRILEGPFVPLACLANGGHRRCADCRDERLCAVRRVFAKVAAASGEILDGTTLADVLSDPAERPDGERPSIILVKR
ncbi:MULTISPECIES: RrF2 family transcriptional regulator [Shinella]|jgi:Rrf2 family protein|uniref:BadM/Rrf2 family transcriptional regulator n=1 Tax=Shinella granuli TaxID=323621 RepID=A0A4R2CVG0_SHIGR|nr:MULTISPECIES: Rrf2 family transcriptional regulator [Shinella]ANH03152.1 Rrf2 family transcriptional regulator [Shinella sp. HZN7]TCN45588.1 BadM/Rrf2 family transcriptional regulator [Shinella granuli]